MATDEWTFESEEWEFRETAVTLDGIELIIYPSRDQAPRRERAAINVVATEGLSTSFRVTMRNLATGVALVTTFVDGRPWGVTVSSCCSLSVDPPRLLVSLQRGTASCVAIEESGSFGVSLLGDMHKGLAEFGAARGTAKFLDTAYLSLGAVGIKSPLVAGALSHFDCEVAEIFDGDDHAIIVGNVIAILAAKPRSGASPLLYFDGGFHHLGPAV